MKKLISQYNTDHKNLAFLFSFFFGGRIKNQPAPAGAVNDSFSEIYRVKALRTESHEFYFYAGDDVEIKLEFDGSDGFDLDVYDSKAKRVLSRSGCKGSLRAVLPVFYSGSFTIKITNREAADMDYALGLKAF